MKKDYTLVILAAGMGSRYGGTKQLDAVSGNDETIMDFSLFDAIKAGFTKVVFIIRKDILEEVREDYNKKLKGKVEVQYVCQEVTDVPDKFKENNRVKPWGTGHALLVAKDLIKDNFCVINADDFYGYDAFKSIISFLKETKEDSTNHAMVGYQIFNTLSDNGSVSRGECFIGENNKLNQIIERTSITKKGSEIVFTNDNSEELVISNDTLVSMNFWGFTPDFLKSLDSQFHAFLEENSQELKSEFFLPSTVDSLIKENKATVNVLKTTAKWMGVTYREDKDTVMVKVAEFKAAGLYPAKLW
jgi:UTP-glucose-1-phosphate uridylyltransferase